jgi:hypothetical protein
MYASAQKALVDAAAELHRRVVVCLIVVGPLELFGDIHLR